MSLELLNTFGTFGTFVVIAVTLHLSPSSSLSHMRGSNQITIYSQSVREANACPSLYPRGNSCLRVAREDARSGVSHALGRHVSKRMLCRSPRCSL